MLNAQNNKIVKTTNNTTSLEELSTAFENGLNYINTKHLMPILLVFVISYNFYVCCDIKNIEYVYKSDIRNKLFSENTILIFILISHLFILHYKNSFEYKYICGNPGVNTVDDKYCESKNIIVSLLFFLSALLSIVLYYMYKEYNKDYVNEKIAAGNVITTEIITYHSYLSFFVLFLGSYSTI